MKTHTQITRSGYAFSLDIRVFLERVVFEAFILTYSFSQHFRDGKTNFFNGRLKTSEAWAEYSLYRVRSGFQIFLFLTSEYIKSLLILTNSANCILQYCLPNFRVLRYSKQKVYQESWRDALIDSTSGSEKPGKNPTTPTEIKPITSQLLDH